MAASLGQVYKGRLKENGDLVAVKVQRPFVLETVTVDLYIIRNLGLVLRKFPQVNFAKLAVTSLFINFRLLLLGSCCDDNYGLLWILVLSLTAFCFRSLLTLLVWLMNGRPVSLRNLIMSMRVKMGHALLK